MEISTVDIRFEGQNLFYYISVFNSVDEQEFIKLLSTKITSFVKLCWRRGREEEEDTAEQRTDI